MISPSEARAAGTMPLYEVATELLGIEEQLAEGGGELTPELEAQLDALQGSFDERVEAICFVVQNNRRAADAAKAEAERLAALAAARMNVADRLKAYLLAQMQRLERPKVETGRFVVAVQKNSRPAIRWSGALDDLPESFRRVKIEVDGAAAFDAYKRGEPLPAGFEVEQGQHLRIR